jgi:hypothetical protein
MVQADVRLVARNFRVDVVAGFPFPKIPPRHRVLHSVQLGNIQKTRGIVEIAHLRAPVNQSFGFRFANRVGRP